MFFFEGVSSSGMATVSRDLLNKVVALNVVRSLMDGNLPSAHIDFNRRMNTMGSKFIDTIFWAFKPVLKSDALSDEDIKLIKQFFLHLATSEHDISLSKINEYLNQFLSKCKGFSIMNDDPAEVMSNNIELIMEDLDLDESEDCTDIPSELLMIGAFLQTCLFCILYNSKLIYF